MPRYQFNLRQLLMALPVVALLLLLVRFAMQFHGLAVALLVLGIGACILLVANFLLSAFLRGVGAISGLEPNRDDKKVEPAKSSIDESATR